MHYYKKNIGDYHKKAGRLSMLEHGAYMLLMDACYDRERFPTREEAIDWLWAHSDEEIAAIDFVLSKFFKLEDDGTYTQDRIQEELAAYHAMAATNQRIAKEREAKRREAKNKNKDKGLESKGEARSADAACDSVNEAPPNQEPLTTNQEPRTNSNDDVKKTLNIPFDVFWKTYAKSAAKDKCEAKWKSLSSKVREDIMQHLPAYVASTPVKKFRKDPMTYLNAKGWLDDIIVDEPSVNQKSTASYNNMNVNAKYDDPNYDPLDGLTNRTGATQ